MSTGHEKENKDIENAETKENNSMILDLQKDLKNANKVNCKLKFNIFSAKKN